MVLHRYNLKLCVCVWLTTHRPFPFIMNMRSMSVSVSVSLCECRLYGCVMCMCVPFVPHYSNRFIFTTLELSCAQQKWFITTGNLNERLFIQSFSFSHCRLICFVASSLIPQLLRTHMAQHTTQYDLCVSFLGFVLTV